jgi:hypothetical protein
MTTTAIKTLDDVLLFELQQSKIKMLTFWQAWKVCQPALRRLPLYAGHELMKNQFAHELLDAIQNIENKGFVTVIRRGTGRYRKILEFKLTDRGNSLLSATIFTHQERTGGRH